MTFISTLKAHFTLKTAISHLVAGCVVVHQVITHLPHPSTCGPPQGWDIFFREAQRGECISDKYATTRAYA